MSAPEAVFLDGPINNNDCPYDAMFEHRHYYPYLGACVPRDLSETTGKSKKYRQRWAPDFPNAKNTPHGKGKYLWDGGCDLATAPRPPKRAGRRGRCDELRLPAWSAVRDAEVLLVRLSGHGARGTGQPFQGTEASHSFPSAPSGVDHA